MNQIKQHIAIYWLAGLILFQLFVLSFKFNILFITGSLVMFYMIYKTPVSKDFLKLIKPLFFVFIIAFIGTFRVGGYKSFHIIKDILHFLKPIMGLSIGYIFVREIGSEKKFIKLIIALGVISSLYHFYLIGFKTDLSSGTVSALRYHAKDNFLEIVSLFLVFYYKKMFDETLTKKRFYYYIIMAVLILSFILYFSRTMYVILMIFALSFFGFTTLNRRNINILMLFLLMIIGLYIYLFSIKLNSRATGLEGFLYKIKMAPEEVFDARLNTEHMMYLGENWRAYEVKRAYELMRQNPETFVWGTGYGSLVNLRFWAPLGTYKKGMKYISELHNGYMYVFYKTGVLGFSLFSFFLVYLYHFINRGRSYLNILISGLGLSLIFSSLVFTGFYNYRDIYTMILGGLLFFYLKQKASKTITD